jgi:hypothetical protein
LILGKNEVLKALIFPIREIVKARVVMWKEIT